MKETKKMEKRRKSTFLNHVNKAFQHLTVAQQHYPTASIDELSISLQNLLGIAVQ